MKALMDDPATLVKKAQEPEPGEEENEHPVPTAMEMALRSAMERSQNENDEPVQQTSKKSSTSHQELESILSRTLKNKK